MKEEIQKVQDYYNSDVECEWNRLNVHPFEFTITTRMMDRYIKSGDKVLDIGGGPGRYSLYYAKKGCDVTLFDLSRKNIEFAKAKAAEHALTIDAYVGNALEVTEQITGEFDHVFVMGPMYHLLEEKERMTCIEKALQLLKPGGKLYVSFIQLFAGMIFDMKYQPENVLQESE